MADYRLTTSIPELGSAPLPSTQVGEYLNQQIVGTENRAQAEAARNLAQPGGVTTRESQQVAVQEPVQTNLDSTVKAVEASNKRLAQYTQQARTGGTKTSSSSGTGTGSYGSNTYTVPYGVTGSRASALSDAASYLGTRYVLGGTSKQGIDCSGLVMMVYNKMGYNISRHSATWQRDNIPGVRTNDLNSLRPGDIVAWKDGSHIAIYAGNGQIIEAANERVGTVRRPLWTSPSNVVGIKLRFPGE